MEFLIILSTLFSIDETLDAKVILEQIHVEVKYWQNLKEASMKLWTFGVPAIKCIISTDASSSGYGVQLNSTRIGGQFENESLGLSIMLKEALAVQAAIIHLKMSFNKEDTGKLVLFYVDNTSLCDCWSKRRSKNEKLNKLIFEWGLIEMQMNYHFKFVKVSTVNQEADGLSRIKFDRSEMTHSVLISKKVGFFQKYQNCEVLFYF